MTQRIRGFAFMRYINPRLIDWLIDYVHCASTELSFLLAPSLLIVHRFWYLLIFRMARLLATDCFCIICIIIHMRQQKKKRREQSRFLREVVWCCKKWWLVTASARNDWRLFVITHVRRLVLIQLIQSVSTKFSLLRERHVYKHGSNVCCSEVHFAK